MVIKAISYNGEESNTADIKVYLYDKERQIITFTAPQWLRDDSYLVVGYNTRMYRQGLHRPIWISARQKLFGDAGIAETVGINYLHDYKVVKMSEDDLWYMMELTALDKKTAYQQAKLWVTKDGLHLRRAVLKALNGQPYFTMQTRAADINISGELVTDFTYSHVKEGIPDIIKRDMETDENVFLQLNISGLYNDYQYNVRVKGNTSDFTFDLEGITLSCIAGPTLFEIGKRRWIWGKGFSYSPTYPLDKEKDYWGSEWILVKNNYNMAIGAVLDEDSDELYSGWVRLISLLTTSDYTVVLSYLNDKINTEIRDSGGQVLQVRIPEDYINLGVNYSRDFLNGLEGTKI